MYVLVCVFAKSDFMRFSVQDKAAEEKHKENLIYKRQLIGLLAKVNSCTEMCTHGVLSSSSSAFLAQLCSMQMVGVTPEEVDAMGKAT